MHEAYEVFSLLKLTLQIECITAFDENLLVGTRQGHLFMYNLIQEQNEQKSMSVQLVRHNKSFSKKAIQQLEVIPDHHLLISLTDNMIQLHDMNSTSFTTIQQLPKTKGATLFATSSTKHVSLTGASTILIRLVVAVKRKLQFYYLKNNEFLTLMDDKNLIEVPRAMVWCLETICIGYRGEYILLELDGKQTELFPTSSSRSNDPCIVKVSDTTFALCRESQTVFVNVKGDTEKTKALRWSDVPFSLVWDEPYAVGVLPETVEIQALESNGVVQTLSELSKIRFIMTCQPGLIYAGSVSQIWAITAIDVAQQRKALLDSKQFQLALKLTEMSNENDEDKKEKIHQIQTLLAYDLFANKQFHESMRQFLNLGVDPYDVIRLFPDLLPQSAGGTQDLDPVKDLTEKELETGFSALIDYLTEMRHRLQSENSPANVNARGNLNEEKKYSKSTQQLLQIIDTTLLKCYLHTNDALVAPLLRLNHCHLTEAEKILKKMGKQNELIILYQTKGQHRRALELLKAEMRIERTISYLQNLGEEHLGLIIEFSDWVLNASEEEGIKIFTEDLYAVEKLPRPRILDYLLRSHNSVVIRYLEHVIDVWNDDNVIFHNALIHQYLQSAKSEGQAASEFIRKKLLNFLKTSHHYSPETILKQFPADDFLEERAIIFGRLGKFDEAIALFVRALGDIQKAIDYCETIYESQTLGYQKAYVSLIKIILDPNSCSLTLPGLVLSPKTAQPDLELALDLLTKYATKINTMDALSIIPDNVPVARIHKFLLIALRQAVQERRRIQLLKGLLYAEHIQCQEMRLNLQNQHVLITELNVCPVCKKRFGNQSALIRYPNGEVVHYSCQEKRGV